MGSLGTGAIILVVLWITCILVCYILDGAPMGLGIISAAVIITLILWFLPRGHDPDDPYIVYDYSHLYRVPLISICGIFLLAGLIVIGMFELFEQRRAMPLKPAGN